MSAPAKVRSHLQEGAALGWPVIPLVPRTKIPFDGSGGCRDATTNQAQIDKWDQDHPDCNVGLGIQPSGFLIWDIDPRNGGAESQARVEERFGPLPETPMSHTGRGDGGTHRLFNRPELPEGYRFKSSIEIIDDDGTRHPCPGIDIKTDGYIVIPPSIHPDSGQPYQWDIEWSPFRIPPADLPAWALSLVMEKISGNGGRPAELPELIPEGARDTTLTSVAGSLRNAGLTADEMDAALQVMNAKRCVTKDRSAPLPLPEKRVRGIAESIGRKEAGKLVIVEAPDKKPDPAQARRPVPLDLASIRKNGLPPIPWLIEGWIATDDIGLIAGGAYSGKSTTAYDLAHAVSSGRQWLGMKPQCIVRVMLIDEEQGSRETARLALRLGDPNDNLRIFSCQGFRLDAPEGIALLEQEIADFKPGLIIIDSVQQAFGAADEKDATEVGLVYHELFRLREAYGLAILLIHHKRKSSATSIGELIEMIRGSTAHSTQPSAVFYQTRSGQGRSVDLFCVKRRGAEQPPAIRVGIETECADGMIRLVNLGTPKVADESKAAVWLAQYLASCSEAQWKDILAAGREQHLKERAIRTALHKLEKAGQIDKPSRGVYRFVQTPVPIDELPDEDPDAWSVSLTCPEGVPMASRSVPIDGAPGGLMDTRGGTSESPAVLDLGVPTSSQRDRNDD